MDRSEKRDFDKASKTWDENPGRVRLARCVVDAILAELPVTTDMDAADYGCGTGLVTLGLQPYVRSIVGLDSSAGMLEVLDAKVHEQGITNVRTAHLDLESERPPELSADLLVCSITMHHISDIRRVLNAFADMLRPGGYIAIADLDPDDGEFHQDNTGVVHPGFDRNELTGALKSAGFGDVHTTTACVMSREVAGKGMRDFSIFLLTGRKTSE